MNSTRSFSFAKAMRVAIYSMSFIVFSNESCDNRGKGQIGADGTFVGGDVKFKCEKPNRTYTKEIDSSLKAELGQLANVPPVNLDANLKTTVVKLTDYSTQGLDRDLLLFRICEMSLNRGLTGEQTQDLITSAMGTWDEELKKKNSSQK